MGRWVAKWLGKINFNTRFYNYRQTAINEIR